MRIRHLVVASAAVLAVSSVSAVHAQGTPSANDIIKALKPSGSMLSTTRGIRPAAPPAPSAAQPVAAQMPAPVHAAPARAPVTQAVATQGPSVNLTIQFQNGSAELTPQAIKSLDALGKALSSADLAGFRFRIEGHTDTVGGREYNQRLSQERADAVAAYLEKNYGVGANRVEAVGKGQDGLLVPTPDNTPEPRNRRVQVINLGT